MKYLNSRNALIFFLFPISIFMGCIVYADITLLHAFEDADVSEPIRNTNTLFNFIIVITTAKSAMLFLVIIFVVSHAIEYTIRRLRKIPNIHKTEFTRWHSYGIRLYLASFIILCVSTALAPGVIIDCDTVTCIDDFIIGDLYLFLSGQTLLIISILVYAIPSLRAMAVGIRQRWRK